MAYPLTSPGSYVSVTDESPYATAGEGTVPLFIIGTHEYKTGPSGSGVAEGTLPENAGALYRITSQRELLQTFGNPVFYKKNGASVHGYEINEYGLHAAYQYMGVANRAFVLRAPIDYAQLRPRATEPRSAPSSGTTWLDTVNNIWGVYEWTGTQWVERDLNILDSESDLDTTVNTSSLEITGFWPPKATLSANGDFAIAVNRSKKVLYQKISGAWKVVGGSSWKTTKRAAQSSTSTPNLIYQTYLPAAGTLGDVVVRITPANVLPSNITARWTLKTYDESSNQFLETQVPVLPAFYQSALKQTQGSVYLAFGADDSHSALGQIVNNTVNGVQTTTYQVDPANTGMAVFEFRRFDGTVWAPLDPFSSAVAPDGAVEDGTYWYNNLNLVVNVKVSQNGNWVSYTDVHTQTDPAGVILRASAPTEQSDGTTLVDHDLWIDTSDLENFPKMFRRDTGRWVAVDLEDSINPIRGIAFGEADTTSALGLPDGMKLFDLAASTNDVKMRQGGKWVNVSGRQTNGVPFFGRKAQRQMIVQALASTIESNENIRAENIYFNLIAAPGYVELVDEMVRLNTDMKQVAFVVADTPIRLQPTGTAITSFVSGVGNTETSSSMRDPYMAMYYPWGLSTNVDGSEIMVPPSTIAMRTIAYSDSVSYPWLAPAGFTRGLVSNASSVGYLDEQGRFRATILSESQRGLLYSNNINSIAYIPNRGLVVMGQKTRHNLSTSLDRINVARLVNYLRFNLDLISKPFLFEPNDFHTRDSVKTTFERFLANLVGLRGLYDFVVVCDESNNTPDRIDRHELWVDVAIKPVQAIEFIYIPVRIVNTGDDLS